MTTKKQNRGGARNNAGAKPKYNEPTDTFAIRCPVSKIKDLKKIIMDQLLIWAEANPPAPRPRINNLDDLNPNA